VNTYVDSCVYIDFDQWRPGSRLLYYGEEAEKMFKVLEEGKFILVVSDVLDHQLKGCKKYVEIKTRMSDLGRLIEIQSTQHDKEEAKRRSRDDDWEDDLHAVLAIRAGAKIFVTQNERDFSKYRKELNILTPTLFQLELFRNRRTLSGF
jgi:predicted nucleic acid-binding protein